MFEKNLDIIYNKKYVILLPTTVGNLKEGFAYTFGNTVLIGNTVKEYDQTLSFLSNNNFQKTVDKCQLM